MFAFGVGGGGGGVGWESIVHSVPVKNDNVFLSIGSFFFFFISGAIDGNHIPFSLYSIFETTTPLPSKLK